MNKIKLALTTGDVDGIGLEIAAKALDAIGPKKNVQFFLWRSSKSEKKYLDLIDNKFTRITVTSLEQGLIQPSTYDLIDISTDLSPARWVEITANGCLDSTLTCMSTGPISKTLIKNSGLNDLGHTDILKRICKTKNAYMAFIGSKFNVILGTGHIPVSEIKSNLTYQKITEAILHANNLRLLLSEKNRNKPIGILGLNPHAGEDGIIGDEEKSLFPSLFSYAEKEGIPLQGPLVPDAAFLSNQWKKYSVYLALYHDQGLIPFKMIHGQDSGVHVTLGLPIIRTSVDHGTAKDIFGKDVANPNSMIDAIKMAIKLSRQK